MEWMQIILGLVLLLFGRRLYWLFVAIAGVLAGVAGADLLLPRQPQWVVLVLALGAGVLGAFAAVFVQRLGFALAGFFAGAYLALLAAQSFGAGDPSGVVIVGGGVIGAVFATWILDWALIMLSCLVGAGAVVHGLILGHGVGAMVFVALVIVGLFVQARVVRRPGPPGHGR
jgi:hypothetical protein